MVEARLQPVSMRLATAPALEPVTVDEFRDHARVSEPSDTERIQRMISSARLAVERFASIALIDQTWEQAIDGTPSAWYVELLRGPLLSVTSVKWYDLADAEQTLNASNYVVDVAGNRIFLSQTGEWPGSTRPRRSMLITFKAGFGTTADSVPWDLRLAVLMLAAHYWERPEAASEMTLNEVPMGIRQLVASYRRNWL